MGTTLRFDRLPARTGSSSSMTDNVTGLRDVLERRGLWHPGSLAA
ncbi:hypothetical protein ACTMTI_39040 [Nonomuraea sp. H19]